MAILEKNALMDKIREYVGDKSDDISIALIEDINDTIEDFTSKIGEDWKAKFDENDAMWRKKYRDRFFEGGERDEEEKEEEKKTLSFEELFEDKEVN